MSSSPEWATWLIQAYAIQQQQQQVIGTKLLLWHNSFQMRLEQWIVLKGT